MIKLLFILFIPFTSIANESVDSEYCLENIREISVNLNYDRRCEKVLIHDSRFKKHKHSKGEIYYYKEIIIKVSNSKEYKVLAGDKTKLRNVISVYPWQSKNSLYVYDCEKKCQLLKFIKNTNGNVVPRSIITHEEFQSDSFWYIDEKNNVIVITNKANGIVIDLNQDIRRKKEIKTKSHFSIPENCGSRIIKENILSCSDPKYNYKIDINKDELIDKKEI